MRRIVLIVVAALALATYGASQWYDLHYGGSADRSMVLALLNVAVLIALVRTKVVRLPLNFGSLFLNRARRVRGLALSVGCFGLSVVWGAVGARFAGDSGVAIAAVLGPTVALFVTSAVLLVWSVSPRVEK